MPSAMPVAGLPLLEGQEMKLIERLKHARRAGVPLVAIATADQAATISAITKEVNGNSPVVIWDVVRGCRPGNALGKPLAQSTINTGEDVTAGVPTAMLSLALGWPEKSIIFAENWDQFLKAEDTPGTLQGVANLRDVFKADGRMLIMLSPGKPRLPEALRGHVEVMEDELPSAEELREIVTAQDKAASNGRPEWKPIDRETLDHAVEAVKGLNAFAAEQAVAMALRRDGIDLDHLRETKRGAIGQITGLSFDEGTETFADMGGLAQVKRLGERVFAGRESPVVVLRMEEIGKVMGGAKTDMSGTSQDALQCLLNMMEDNGWTGIIAYGPAGTGKSMYSKVLAKTFGAFSMTFDINATKGRLVGQSEQQVRAAMDAVKAIGGRRVFIVATSNEMDTLPPELRRRFRLGVWYFDMPDREERDSIWKLNRLRFSISKKDDRPDDSEYSAANIRDCCEVAAQMQCSLLEAAEFILPAGVAGREQIERSRANADGRYLAASFPGVYRRPEAVAKGRALEV